MSSLRPATSPVVISIVALAYSWNFINVASKEAAMTEAAMTKYVEAVHELSMNCYSITKWLCFLCQFDMFDMSENPFMYHEDTTGGLSPSYVAAASAI